MAERISLLIRAALHAIALLYPTGKVTIIENVGPGGNAKIVNVDVTDREDLREQLAEAIIECDVYHVHDTECFPWETWTTDRGEIWRGLVGQLLTMWVRVEELVGHEPVPAPAAASDPATAPVTLAPWVDRGSGTGGVTAVADRDPIAVRPYVLAHAAQQGALGIARVDGSLSEPPEWPVPAPHPLAELVDAAPVPVIPGDTAEDALRRWIPAAIETDLLRGGPFGRRTEALAAVKSHPAADMIDDETALAIAEALVRPVTIPRPRAPWWTLGGILGGAQ